MSRRRRRSLAERTVVTCLSAAGLMRSRAARSTRPTKAWTRPTTAANNALAMNVAAPAGVDGIAGYGILTLTGTVSYGSQRAAAEPTVASVTGIRRIKRQPRTMYGHPALGQNDRHGICAGRPPWMNLTACWTRNPPIPGPMRRTRVDDLSAAAGLVVPGVSRTESFYVAMRELISRS